MASLVTYLTILWRGARSMGNDAGVSRLFRALTLSAAITLMFTGCSSEESPGKAAADPTSSDSAAPDKSTSSPATSPSAKATANTQYDMGDYKAAVLAYFDEQGDAALKDAPFKIKGRAQFGCLVNAFAGAQNIDDLRAKGAPEESVSAFFNIGSGETGKPTIPQAEKLLDGVEGCKIDLRPALISSIANGMAAGIADKSQVTILTTCVDSTIPDSLVREFLTATMTEQNPNQSEAMTAWQSKAEKCLTDKGYDPAAGTS